jgi:hypothetical protein
VIFRLPLQKKKRKERTSRALIAHACNPSYSGGRDQEDCGSKPAQANSFRNPISKKILRKKKKKKKAGEVAQKKKKKKKKRNNLNTITIKITTYILNAKL